MRFLTNTKNSFLS